jgi:glycosyltransferase involved in cell wall biosynthesis
VLRLAEAFADLGRGDLAFVGGGPLRGALEGRSRVRVVGPVPHERVSEWLAACDVLCQPSLVEPFGIALLEAMASGRSVVATRVGGPPEFVPPEAGALVDPADVSSIREGLLAAEALPRPNEAARRAAERHDVRLEARRVATLLERAQAAKPAQ